MIKKLLIVMLTYLLTFSGFVVDVGAIEDNIEDFECYVEYYEDLNTKGYSIVGYNGTNPNIVIPETIDGIPVLEIKLFELPNIQEIESIRIPKSVIFVSEIIEPVKEIIVDSQNNNYIVEDGVLYTKNYLNIIKCIKSKTSYQFNERVKCIFDYCFSGTGITSLVIPETVELIN